MTDPTIDARALQPDALAAHATFLSALARSLVFGSRGGSADDLAQDAALATLQAPAPRGSLQRWVAGITRNVWRGQQRARRRDARHLAHLGEQRRGEAVRPTDDLVAEEEVRRDVATELLRLEEPFRTALVMRFYDDLQPAEIARRLGVPPATVRTRIHRGIDRLRGRLDDRHGGDRGAWVAALTPLALRAVGATAAATSSVPVGLILAAAAVLTLTAWLVFGSDDGLMPTSAQETAGLVVDEGRDLLASESAPEGAPVAATPELDRVRVEERETTPDPVTPGVVFVRGRGDEPVANAPVQVRFGDARADVVTSPVGRLETDALGVDWTGPATLWLTTADETLYCFEHVRPPESEDRVVHVPVSGQVALDYRTVDDEPIAPSEVLAQLREHGVAAEVELVRVGSGSKVENMFRMMCGSRDETRRTLGLRVEGGRLVLDRRLGPGSWDLCVPRADSFPRVVRATIASGSVQVTVPARPVEPTAIRFVEADTGAPLVGAEVRAFVETQPGDVEIYLAGPVRRTDPLGITQLPLVGPSDSDQRLAWSVRTDTHGGTMTLVPSRVGDEVRVQPLLTVLGRAWTKDGMPAHGSEVVFASKAFRRSSAVAPDGRYRLDGVAALDDGALCLFAIGRSGTGEMPATFLTAIDEAERVGPSTLRLDIGRPRGGGCTFAGRVLAGGKPVEGVVVLAKRDGGLAHTDADGRFEMTGLAAGTVRPHVLLGEPAVGEDDIRIVPDEAIELAAGERIDVLFDLPGGAIRVQVHGPDGMPISGAAVVAQPVRDRNDRGRFDGFEWWRGWSASTDANGEALLIGLEPGELHDLRAWTTTDERRRIKVKSIRAAGNAETAQTVRIEIPATGG